MWNALWGMEELPEKERERGQAQASEHESEGKRTSGQGCCILTEQQEEMGTDGG